MLGRGYVRHTKNLQNLVLQIYKCLPKKDVKHELRAKNILQIPSLKTNTIGADSLISRGAHFWNTLSDTIKNANSTTIFKRKTKRWNGDKCNWKIYK